MVRPRNHPSSPLVVLCSLLLMTNSIHSSRQMRRLLPQSSPFFSIPPSTMNKFYCKGTGTGTGTVHPCHSPISEQFSLSYLPAAILTIAASLSAEDKEVLAYLLSASATAVDFSDHHHPPSSTCYCFSCYTTFWARWDSSPNRHLIHQIIDALEDGFFAQGNKKQGINRRERRKNNKNSKVSELNANDRRNPNTNGSHGSGRVNPELGPLESKEEADDGGQLRIQGEATWEKQGSVRKIVSFIGERIWGSVGVWG